MFTFGLPWNPWKMDKTMAPGAEISSYLVDSAARFGIDKRIKYQHRVLSARWSSQKSRWILGVEVDGASVQVFEARFLILGTGYYNYDEPLPVHIPGIDNFAGTVIHPQFWPRDFDYADKDIVIIGSGATAVTLLPSLASKASHTTMLQRSPTYIAPVPSTDKIAKLERTILPARLAPRVTRLRRAVRFFGFYWFCKAFPSAAKRLIRQASIKLLPPTIPVDPHFTPRYNPMDQRLCASPDGDFFAALRSGKASVVTDTIEAVTKEEIQLSSGEKLRPDVIITATGLKLRIGGGIQFFIDDKAIEITDRFAWKGFMLQDVPNLAFVTGYYNAAWTLGAEVTGLAVVRLLRQMKDRGVSSAVPRLRPSELNMVPESFFKLSSTYVKDSITVTPRGGTGQWAHRWNYFFDVSRACWGDHSTGLEYH
jgi:cation diffusion facilitator CzcD-associated flavoprotein CzcO